ncbi:DUF6245 family protein [Streptomyces spongiicola]|uniref:DUF6245 family protein n=1 Tax=Streptomyces spongiicola TaxID=1690221 RepID=UPI00403D466E
MRYAIARLPDLRRLMVPPSSKEQAAEVVRLGGEDAYRVRMVNALLSMVQGEAAMADGVKLDDDARHAAWEEQLKAAGAGLDDSVWQVLRAGTPLRLMVQNQGAWPIPLAAAYAATGDGPRGFYALRACAVGKSTRARRAVPAPSRFYALRACAVGKCLRGVDGDCLQFLCPSGVRCWEMLG